LQAKTSNFIAFFRHWKAFFPFYFLKKLANKPKINLNSSLTVRSEKIVRLGLFSSYLTNLHYINWSDPQAARLTGMTRFACFWVESGEIVGPIQDLRFDDTLYSLFGSELASLTKNRSTFIKTETYQKRTLGGMIVPGMLLNKMNFTL
jgi:hypothetical protein